MGPAFAEGRATAIQNGIDLELSNPSQLGGTAQAAPYSREDFSGKAACKTAVQAELDLPIDADAPLFFSGGRICQDKGIQNLVGVVGHSDRGEEITALDQLLRENPSLQVVVGGEVTEPWIGEALERLAARWPRNVRLQFGYVNNRQLMAAADVFLIPSVSEPCGLTQMESMALGTPVVYADVDGLSDSVSRYDPIFGGGEGFRCERDDVPTLLSALREAAAWATQPAKAKDGLRRNCMDRSVSFDSETWARNMKARMREAINCNDRQRRVL